jgi:hypothetical protein
VQGESSREVLEELVEFFGCGRVFRNRRHDNHREDLFRYCVQRFDDLRTKIVPFFEEHPLRTSKRHNFEKFARIVKLMELRRHLSLDGIVEIAEIQQNDEFSKTVRSLENPQRPYAGPLLNASKEEEMVRTLRRRRESGRNDRSVLLGRATGNSFQRNSLSGKFRPARMA